MLPPFAYLALSFVLGVALAEPLAERARIGSAVAVATVLGALLVLMLARLRRRGFGIAALAQTALLGAVAAASAHPITPTGVVGATPARVRAHVTSPVERLPGGGVRVALAVDEVERDGVARAADEPSVRVHLGTSPAEPLSPGDGVLLEASLHRPHGFALPDEIDPGIRLAASGIAATAGTPATKLIRLADADSASSLFERITAHLRAPLDHLRGRMLSVAATALAAGDARALVESLVLGERSDVDPTLDEAFRITGVAHVLSVSGLHLACAALLFHALIGGLLLRLTPLARRVIVARWAAFAALPATLAYTVLTGAAVATVRSCVVAWIFLGATALGRRAPTANALACAALVLLLPSPLSLYDPSLQLSFAAAIGLWLLAPRLGLGPATAPLPAVDESRLRRRARAAWRTFRAWLGGLVRASVAALIASAPIAAWHFGQLAPVGLVMNVFVVPLAELWVLPVGLAGCATGAAASVGVAPLPVLEPVARALLVLAGGGATVMAAAVRAVASWPLVESVGRVPQPSLIAIAAYYALVVAVAVRSPARLRRVLIALTALLLAGAGPLVWRQLHPSVRLDFLDVGQGDACLVTLPDGTHILVDGGGSFDPSWDPGSSLLVPWLEREGIRRLDVVVLTHPHPDHANGLASVVSRFAVGEVWTNGAPSQLPSLIRLESVARARGIRVARPHALNAGGARVEVLHPLDDRGAVAIRPGASENDGSIVLRVGYAGRTALLAGDVEAAAEAQLLRHGERLAADVVKAPHHGSRTSSTAGFVRATHPSLVVFSVGDGNRWGFPAAAVEDRWRAVGARTLRTDLDGSVTITLGANGAIATTTARQPRLPPLMLTASGSALPGGAR